MTGSETAARERTATTFEPAPRSDPGRLPRPSIPDNAALISCLLRLDSARAVTTPLRSGRPGRPGAVYSS